MSKHICLLGLPFAFSALTLFVVEFRKLPVILPMLHTHQITGNLPVNYQFVYL